MGPSPKHPSRMDPAGWGRVRAGKGGGGQCLQDLLVSYNVEFCSDRNGCAVA